MKYLTDRMAIDVFATLPATFDSHGFEFKMQGLYPVEFRKELNWFRNRKDLKRKDRVQSFSIAMGRWLLKFTGYIAKINRRPKTKNLRGRTTKNREWQKM